MGQAEVLKKTAAALRKDVSFAIFTGKTDNAITLYRSFDEPEVVYSGDVNADAVQAWVKSESLPLLGEIGPQNFMKYVDRNLPLVWVFVDYTADAQKDVLAALTPVAKQYRDKVVFAKLDGNRRGEHAKTFGLSGTTPGVVIEDRATRKNYVFPEDKAVTTEAFSAHVESFLKGGLAATIRSQDIPADNDGPVKVLVAKQYDELVMDNSKDAFVEFYAPWCGHCKTLAPKWEEVAKIFSTEEDVVVANVDADSEAGRPLGQRYGVSGFPTIKYFKKGSTEATDYSAGREVADIVKFLNDNAGTQRLATGGLNDKAGRIASLDEIVKGVVSKAKSAADVGSAAAALKDAEKLVVDWYTVIAKKFETNGADFITKQKTRLGKLLAGDSIAAAKRDELQKKLNILSAFE